jgi:hypothetical protein
LGKLRFPTCIYSGFKKKASINRNLLRLKINPGDVLLFHAVTHIVSLALAGLTALFGMGRGVTPPLKSPEILKIKTIESIDLMRIVYNVLLK